MLHPRPARTPGRQPRVWARVRLAIGAGVLAVVVGQWGADPFLTGLQRVDVWSLVVAAAIGVPTTVGCAWRWRLVSRGLGAELPLGPAVGAYYRSQFLNTVLPGGVLGDVHRAWRRGCDTGAVGQSCRAVVWERAAGQGVQLALTLAVLVVLPSPVPTWAVAVAVAVVGLGVGAVLLGRRLPRRGGVSPGRLGAAVRAIAADVRDGVLSPQLWPGIVLASTVVVAGHAATFLVAARAAGTTVGPGTMLPLALLVLAAAALPTNVAGWGPREGAAAWVFALTGFGAAQGVTTAVVYGVLALVATLPGVVVLAAESLRTARAGDRSAGADDVTRGGPDVPVRPVAGAVAGTAVGGAARD